MKTRAFGQHLLIKGSSLAALACALAMPAAAQAQTAPQPTPAPQDQQPPADPDEIVVTGFAASLGNAVQAKRNSDQIVESISAEEIGRLPDASIAESIARLPGLTSQRVSGRSNNITIRGFAPDFSTTLLNGREQTSTGDNRAVEYDQYPSEVVNQVLVYKTPQANLIGQGLSGTVDLRTIRPLDYGRQVFSLGARGSYADLGRLNAGSREYGYRLSATYVDQFADDTFGVALSASYTDEPYQIQEFNAWGYAGAGTAASPSVIGGSKSYVTSTQLTRLGLSGTLQYRPSPNFTATFDAFFSDFKDDQIKRGIELPLGFNGNPLTISQQSGGFVTAGTFQNVEGVVRNDAFQRHAQLYSFGLNLRFEGDSGWNVTGDISYSRTNRNELILESNAGTGRGAGVGATDTIGFTSGATGTVFRPTLNYGDYNLILLTSPLGWGGDQTSVDGRRILCGQDGYYNNRLIVDELNQYRVEIEREFEGSFLRSGVFGLNYTVRSKRLTPDEAFLGLVANTNGTTSVPVPTQFRLSPTNLSYLGLGPVISYDPIALLNAGFYQLVPNPYGDVVVKAYDIRERIMTGYLQANIDSTIGASTLTGNVGVQFNITDQNSNGAQASYLGTNPNGSPNIAGVPRREGADYIDVLPSLNLSLRFPSNTVIRLGLAREIIRPRLDDMRASLQYGVNIGDTGGQPCPVGRTCGTVRGGSGNPDLRPWRANAADLTFEQYFGRNGYVAAQLFYKDLKSYIYNADVPFNFTGLPIQSPGVDAGGQPIIVNYQGFVNVPINGSGGNLYGVEIAGTIPFSLFTSALEGFGITGGVSYTETSIAPQPGANSDDLPGYSKLVANGTAFFERWGFNVRGSVRYRSSFIGELSGFGAVRTRRRALPETIFDAQIGYDFQEGSTLHGLSVFVQGQNLTDERFATVNPGDARQVIDYQIYGRRFLAGASFRF